jgi:kumamolisin
MTTSDEPSPGGAQPLSGSDRSPVPGARPAARALSARAPIEATVVLRRRAAVGAGSDADLSTLPIGADPDDVALVTRTLTDLGANIVAVHEPSRRVRVSGPAEVLGSIFGTSLELVTAPFRDDGTATFRQRTGGLSVPAPLSGIITAVLGLDDRPAARPRLAVAPAAAVNTSYSPAEVARLYRFPAGTDGSGQTVAILELGGGYRKEDLDTYFAALGIPVPEVVAVGVDGATNSPGDASGADGEVMLDIEVVGAVAPGARMVVYFAPNTDDGFLDALSQATHASPRPTAISISWGQRESGWTEQARTAFSDALQDAAALGVTVTAAAGDNGSSDGAPDGRPHVDFPASSPWALACGGTRLEADPVSGTITAEVVWNNGSRTSATGGGVSTVFPQPSWQAGAGVPVVGRVTGRGVPDVAGNADPQTGYRVRVDGVDTVIGGTSAVSPLWAGLVARLAQATGTAPGFLQPALYRGVDGAVPPGFRDITVGDNGAYSAGPGWDACTGLGVPIGDELLAALDVSPRGGDPEGGTGSSGRSASGGGAAGPGRHRAQEPDAADRTARDLEDGDVERDPVEAERIAQRPDF